MIPTSRKRGFSDDRIIEIAVAITNSPARTTPKSSQLQRGEMPKARMNTNTTTKFRTRLNTLLRTTASGITRRGNCVLRTTDSWFTIELTAVLVASWKKPNSTMFSSSRTA